MAVSLQTLIDRSNRNMANGTHPIVRKSALELVRRAYNEGIYMQISEGHRSYKRQNRLYEQGRTRPGNIVTNARGGQSWHNHGIAVDFFLVSSDGKQALWTVNRKWRRVAQIAKSLGFEWGGDWTSFKDYPHLQMRGGLSLSDLRAGKKPRLVDRTGGKTPKPSSRPSGGGSTTKLKKVKAKGKLSTDGKWGQQVTAHLQKYYGTPQDGILSNQSRNSVTNNLYGGVSYGSGGSVVIKALQKDLGVKADGLLGPSTIRALQKRLGTPQDGAISRPKSNVVVALQKALNKGKIGNKSKASKKNKPSKKSTGMSVDGKWGPAVNRALQKHYGTPQDGVLSGQSRNSVTNNLYGGVNFGSGGSLVIKKLQKDLGVKADGLLGPSTVRALQKALKSGADGIISRPSSAVVKKMQKALNKGNFLKGNKKSKKKKKANLKRDGKWGPSLNRALQRYYNTPVDGILSGQSKNNVTSNLYGGVNFGSGGSLVIKKLQNDLGVKADGLLGPGTIRALQKRLGTPQDGVISRPKSNVVVALQKALNNGRI